MSDPAHAWLVLDASLIRDLGIADKISSYSYLSRGKVYLEEDCDAPRFFHAARLAGYEIAHEKEKHHNGDAPCRNFGRFKEYAQNYHPTPIY